MRDLIRETVLGHTIRLLGGKAGHRLLPYPEEQPNFSVPADWPPPPPSAEADDAAGAEGRDEVNAEVGSSVAGGRVHDEEAQEIKVAKEVKKAQPDSNVKVVTWYSETDPSNPQNWSDTKRAVVMFPLCLLTFAVYVGSSIITGGFPSLMRDFGIGEEEATVTLSIYVIGYGIGALLISPLTEIATLGRNPFYVAPLVAYVGFQAGAARVQTFAGLVILRLITAILGGPVLAVGGASVADMYDPMAIPIMLAIWVIPAFSGPGLGPIFANPAGQANGWRWTMYELLWISGFTTIMLIFLLPETSHSNILLRRAERLRAVTGDESYKSQTEIARGDKDFGQVLSFALIKPFEITVKDPSIAFANAYVALIYASYYLFFTAFPLLYLPRSSGGAGVYHFSFVAEGVAYVSIFASGVIGFAIYVSYQYWYMGPWIAKHGWPVNEKRLETAVPAAVVASMGLWIFAWTSGKGVHWIGSLIGVGVYVMANFVTIQCLFFYIILSYPEYGASILAANDFIRASAAAGMLHAGSPFFRHWGIDGGTSFLAGLTMLGVIGIWALYHYGGRLRARSKFAVGDGPH